MKCSNSNWEHVTLQSNWKLRFVVLRVIPIWLFEIQGLYPPFYREETCVPHMAFRDLQGGCSAHGRVVGQPTLSCFWTLQRKLLPVGFARKNARHRLTPTPASDTAKLHKPFWAQAAKKPVEDVHDDGSIMCYLCLRKMCWTSLHDFWKRSGSPNCCISEFATLSPTCQWGLLDFMSAILPPPPPPPDLNCKL